MADYSIIRNLIMMLYVTYAISKVGYPAVRSIENT